jgi:hypothetical protein
VLSFDFTVVNDQFILKLLGIEESQN